MLWNIVVATIVIGAVIPEYFCQTADEQTCRTVCRGWAWCEMCDKCLYKENAVTKDEL